MKKTSWRFWHGILVFIAENCVGLIRPSVFPRLTLSRTRFLQRSSFTKTLCLKVESLQETTMGEYRIILASARRSDRRDALLDKPENRYYEQRLEKRMGIALGSGYRI